MKAIVRKVIDWYTTRRNAALRSDDYWRYKDGEIIDTNADHYKDRT